MFDFHFGDIKDIMSNPKGYITFIKRMLPRWLNGIPDSECIAIWDAIHQQRQGSKNTALIETGSGASTICLCLYAVMNKKRAFTWDVNGSRGAELRGILNDTIGRSFKVCIWNYWTFINSSSTDPHLGLDIIREMDLEIEFGFFDSLHTSNHLMKEIDLATRNFKSGGVIAIDDANYKNINYNYQYVNMFRKKLGLSQIQEPKNNIGDEYYVIVEKYLREKFKDVNKLEDSYKKSYNEDIFFKYYQLDKTAMNEVGMEKLKKLDHRFDAWMVK